MADLQHHVHQDEGLLVALAAAVRVSLVVAVFVLTQTLDYYYISPLTLAVVLGWRNTWTRVAIANSVLFLPTFYVRRMDLEPVPNLFLLGSLLVPLLIGLFVSLRTRRPTMFLRP